MIATFTVQVAGNDGASSTKDFSLTISAPAPTVSSITPNSGANTGSVSITDLAGTGFQTDATVTLRRSGQIDITTTGITVVSPTSIICTFNLSGATVGLWDVVVTNPDVQSGTLSGAFSVGAPPAVPSNPSPGDGLINLAVDSALSWSGVAPDTTFDIYLDTVNPPVAKVASAVSAATYTPSLALGTRYYWKVVAINIFGQTEGPVWTFATYLPGDISGDGFVNVADLQALVAAWGSSSSGGGTWNANADLNNDGYVNVGDLQILVASWGSSVN
jgi:hypothetical protein